MPIFTDSEAVSTPTAGSVARRDGAGRLQAVDGLAAGDLASIGQLQSYRRISPGVQNANYTLAVGDVGHLVYSNTGAAVTFTVPNDATGGWTSGDWIDVAQWAVGALTIQAAADVTLVSGGVATVGGSYILDSRYSAVRLVRIATNTWLVEKLTNTANPVRLTLAGNWQNWADSHPNPPYERLHYVLQGTEVRIRGLVGTSVAIATGTTLAIASLPAPILPPYRLVRSAFLSQTSTRMRLDVIPASDATGGGPSVLAIEISPAIATTDYVSIDLSYSLLNNL